MAYTLKVNRSEANSCKECVLRSEPIPDECPLWKLDRESMIEKFDSEDSEVPDGCPYIRELDLTEFIVSTSFSDWFKSSMDPAYVGSDSVIKNLMESANDIKL